MIAYADKCYMKIHSLFFMLFACFLINPSVFGLEMAKKTHDRRLVILGDSPTGRADCLAFSPDGKYLAVAINFSQKIVKIYRVADQKVVRHLVGFAGDINEGVISALAFTNNGKQLVVAVREGSGASLRVYNTFDFLIEDRIVQRIPSVPEGYINRMCFSNTDDLLICLDNQNRLHFFSWGEKLGDRRPKLESPLDKNRNIISMQTMTSKRLLIIVSIETIDQPYHFTIWSLDHLADIDKMEPIKGVSFDKEIDEVDQLLNFAGIPDNVINLIFDFEKKRTISNRIFDYMFSSQGKSFIRKLNIQSSNSYSIDYCSNLNLVAVSDTDGNLYIDNLESGKNGFLAKNSVEFLKLVDDENGLQKGKIVWKINGAKSPVVIFDLNNATVNQVDDFALGSRKPDIRKLADSEIKINLSGGNLPFVDTRKVGAYWLTGRLNYNDSDKNYNFQIPIKMPFYSKDAALFSNIPLKFADASLLGCQSPVLFADNTTFSVNCLDPDTQMTVRNFSGHTAPITDIQVSKDQKSLVTGSSDGTIRIWSLTNLKPKAFPDFNFDPVIGLVYFVPKGSESEKLGIKPGDEWIDMDGKSPKKVLTDYNSHAWGYEKGNPVELKFRRNNHTYSVNMNLPAVSDDVRPLVSIYAEDADTWIAWTEEGYYQCGLQGQKLVGWAINQPDKGASSRLISPSQVKIEEKSNTAVKLDEQLNQPKAISAIIETGDRTYESLRRSDPSFLPVNLDLINKFDRLQITSAVEKVNQSQVLIKFNLETEGLVDGLPSVTVRSRIKVNEKITAPSVRKIAVGPGTINPDPAKNGELIVQLQPGENTVELTNYVKYQNMRIPLTDSKTITYEPPADTRIDYINYVYALGVSEFTENLDFQSLQYSKNNAAFFNDLFEKSKAGIRVRRILDDGVIVNTTGLNAEEKKSNESQIKTLKDAHSSGRVSSEQIRTVLTRLKKKIDDDRLEEAKSDNSHKIINVILYISTHGWLDDTTEGNYYLAASDSSKKPDSINKGIRLDDLRQLIAADCQLVLIIDSCHSGSVVQQLQKDPVYKSYFAGDIPNLSIITASTSGQEARQGSDFQSSFFVESMRETMSNSREFDTDQNGFISLDEFSRGIEQKLPRLSRDQQTPQIYPRPPLTILAFPS